MNKLFPITGISVLAIGVLVSGALLFQNMGNLKDAYTEIETNKITISGLQTNLAAKSAEAESLTSQLSDSEAEVNSLEADVATLIGDLSAANSQLDTTKTLLATTQTQLTSAQSSLSTAQSTNSTLTAEIRKIKDARHFTTVAELTDWLQKDDTNTKYTISTMTYIQMSFILQERAARDGYLLLTYILPGTTTIWVSNYAIVGDTMYLVEAGDDSVTSFYQFTSVQPTHPEPLP